MWFGGSKGDRLVTPQAKPIPKPKTKPKPKPKPTQQKVAWNGWIDGIEYKGVVLHTMKSKTTDVYVVAVCRIGERHVVRPYLKWINSSYCRPIEVLNLSKYDKRNFNWEWMEQHAEKR